MYITNQGKIMRKLLGKAAVEPSNDGTTASANAPLPALYRPNTAQNATYATGVPIACFDKSPDGRSAILGGRHVLKAVKIDGLHVRETVDLRAYISASSSSRTTATTSTSDQLSIQDVKWATGPGDNTVFTACANGRIFQYDLAALGSRTPGGAGLDYIQMREDTRQVNTLDVNPHRGSLLLSGSQDGVVRHFDIRAPVQSRSGATFQAMRAFKGNGEAIVQVKWSPKDGVVFACATGGGGIVKWDLRKPNGPVQRIKAHDKSCTSISWHPDGDHLISAGSDNKCYVWDVSPTAEKRQKPKHTISAAAPVAAVSWRPGQWSATNQALRAAQVAVTYDESSQKRYGINAVHIWDLARPTMPYKEIVRFDCSPSSILWHDRDLLWTVGPDGLFTQCDVAFAARVIDRTTVSTMAFSARGDVMMFLDERPQPRRLRPPATHADMPRASGYTSSPNTPMLSISRSDSEDDVVGSFLGPRKRAGRKRRMSTRSANAVSTTPPSGPGEDTAVVSLPQAINATGVYNLQQRMGVGPVPSTIKAGVYGYLSASYLETLHSGIPYVKGGDPMPKRVATALEHFAKAAENSSQFRLAQTWRILAYAMTLLLSRRAQYHRERREKHRKKGSPVFEQWDGQVFHPGARPNGQSDAAENDGARRMAPPKKLEKPPALRSLLAEEIESTSNMPTPLARPMVDEPPNEQGEHARYVPGTRLAPVLEVDSFTLPPAVRGSSPRRRLDSVPLSEASQGSQSTQASLEGYDFYDTDALAKAINVPQVNKKEVPAGSLVPGSPVVSRKPVMRQDSDESFAQMFSISQTSGHSNSSGGSASKPLPAFVPIPGRGVGAGGDAADAEYQSRVRGKELEGSPGSSQLGLLRRALQRTNTEMTATTETTDEDSQKITQTTSGSMASQVAVHPRYEMKRDSSPRRRDQASARSSETADDENPDANTEQDYLPWPDDPPYPHPIESDTGSYSPPLDPYTVLARALQFETRSSALNASAMVLLLKPLVPEHVIDAFQAASILRQHHSRLMGMKLFIEAALLRKLCVKGWPGGVLSDWGEDYPAVSAQAHHGVTAGFLCPNCRKPRELDRTPKSTDTIWQCERCRAVMGPCAVCGHREANPNPPPPPRHGVEEGGHPDTHLIMSTWWYCHGCGHGGHSTCLEAWHSMLGTPAADRSPLLGAVADPPSSSGADFSDGCCPMDGCGHACLPGRWRNETNAARSEEVTRAAGVSRSMSAGERDRERKFSLELGVRGDSVEVGASRAVESVRESLAGDREVSRGSALSSSPGKGSAAVDRERRKSVKFAGT